ncbi:MAG: hypothetical protein J3K34DRAFT_399117 [Monoraphidium minutum]|nr:MAG: hypothetical protein J3K34DRAFT_399117 [Monoraphidium minutum]
MRLSTAEAAAARIRNEGPPFNKEGSQQGRACGPGRAPRLGWGLVERWVVAIQLSKRVLSIHPTGTGAAAQGAPRRSTGRGGRGPGGEGGLRAAKSAGGAAAGARRRRMRGAPGRAPQVEVDKIVDKKHAAAGEGAPPGRAARACARAARGKAPPPAGRGLKD